eukprot:maker-scaffold697_size109876-snap-gene-0.27 protein:Tk05848 transcript:maker-scaffold697_size109876-snap-gene-0.27-mRNA-1 annotation:"single-stranded dna exonuclease"
MIRCNLYKGKSINNFVEAARDAQPRKDEPSFVMDHGNIGYIPNADGAHPYGSHFPNPVVKTPRGYQYQSPPYAVTPNHPEGHYESHDHGFGLQRLEGYSTVAPPYRG